MPMMIRPYIQTGVPISVPKANIANTLWTMPSRQGARYRMPT
ncbi:hypothetical protein BN871_GV_00120 [Paenibacillus sp. P22]|nr:hypothetical protein BN871_GV_00120 [Paenibacillus sp. P22]